VSGTPSPKLGFMTTNALGGFLRARRDAITPAQAGLPAGTGRRAPGLRRAELADLAGISVEYLTRLERGSDRHPSGQVLGSLADALNLSADERIHLYRLVKSGTSGVCGYVEPQPLRPTVLALLDTLEPAPAAVYSVQTDVLACTDGFRKIAEPLGLFDTQPANLTRFLFTDPRAQNVFPEWAEMADARVAGLRAAADLGDQPAAVLAEELSIMAGTQFSRRFAASAVIPPSTGVEVWAGNRLEFETLYLPGPDEHRLVVYLRTGQ
jgi:transcriptional regulator with XRE-family HTH domain